MAVGVQGRFEMQPAEIKTWGADFRKFFSNRTDGPDHALMTKLDPKLTCTKVEIEGLSVWFTIVLTDGAVDFNGKTFAGTVSLWTTNGDKEDVDFEVKVKD